MAVKKRVITRKVLNTWRREMRTIRKFLRRRIKISPDMEKLETIRNTIGVGQSLHTRIVNLLYSGSDELRRFMETEMADQISEMKTEMYKIRFRIMMYDCTSRIIRNHMRRSRRTVASNESIFS